ncbi:MAG: pantothenate kinase [Cyanobacteria bacterium J083]|nr:MAG: pantothenate kinase [Cyanobacteria bacterium J083]
MQILPSDDWLCLAIGNSRLHWGKLRGKKILATWHTNHLSTLPDFIQTLPLCIASVVPEQTNLWRKYPNVRILQLSDIPLEGVYSTLGIDRALAVWGAAVNYGLPCLVIDGGTALTITGVDSKKVFQGGAILPGLKLQLMSLAQQTSALAEIQLPVCLPEQWAINTQAAIASGIIYTLLAGLNSFISDWLCNYPNSQICLTGGDGLLIQQYLQQGNTNNPSQLKFDGDLVLAGIADLVLTSTFK